MAARFAVSLIAAVALALLAAPPSRALTVYKSWASDGVSGTFGTLAITEDSAPETNTVTVTGGYDQVTVHDATAPVRFIDEDSDSGGSGECTQLDPHTVTCPMPAPAEEAWQYSPCDALQGDDASPCLIDTGGLHDRVTVDFDVDVFGVFGGDGNDRLATKGSKAVVRGGAGDDQLRGGPEPDSLEGGAGLDLLDGGAASDTLHGGTGTDTLSYATRTSSVTVRLDQSRNDGTISDARPLGGDRDISIENVVGGSGPDALTGSVVVNRLAGGPGDDRLDGGARADTLDGGRGTDTVSYAARTAEQPVAVRLDGIANDGADPGRDGTSTASEEGDRDIAIENAVGGAGADFLRAILAGRNVLDGLAGDDRIFARDGTSAQDAVQCGEGHDQRQTDPSDMVIGCEVALP